MHPSNNDALCIMSLGLSEQSHNKREAGSLMNCLYLPVGHKRKCSWTKNFFAEINQVYIPI